MNGQEIIDLGFKLHPLAQPGASLDEQRRAVAERAYAFTCACQLYPEVEEAHPNGIWEEDSGSWCFCESGPSGHAVGSESGCLFDDDEDRSCMCESCRRPCDIEVKHWRESRGYYGGAPAYEDIMEIRSTCCQATVVLPNGLELNEYED